MNADRQVDHGVLRAVAARLFAAAGSHQDEARIVADHLIDANLRGHDSHGVIRVAKYVDWVRADKVVPNRHADIVSDRGMLLVIDGGFGYGQVIGLEAMALTAARAKQHGVCTTAIRNAGHLGRIGAFAEQLADEGLASVHFVNTSGFGILMAPHGGSDRRLSANPIAAGAPVPGGPPLVLDIATSIVAEGKIQVARNRGKALEPGWVIDGHGKPTNDPATFYAEPPGAIFPFGAHKGYGLSVFCEILAGALTGGGSSHPSNPTAGRLVNNMLTLAFDPQAFAGADFAADIARFSAWVKDSPPLVPGGVVELPGDIERRTMQHRRAAGIPLDPVTISELTRTARLLAVDLPSELTP